MSDPEDPETETEDRPDSDTGSDRNQKEGYYWLFRSFLVLSRREMMLAGGVLALALLVRGLYLYNVSGHVLFDFPVIDGAEYQNWARTWIQNGFTWDVVPIHMPLYAVVNYLNLSLFGATFWYIYLFQTMIGLVTAVLVFYLTRRLFRTEPALLALFLFALHDDWILFESRPVPAVITGFLLTLSLVFLVLSRRRSHPLYLLVFLSGCAIATALFARINVLIILPFVVLLICYREEWTGRQKLLTSGAWLLPSVAVVLFMGFLNNSLLEEKYGRGGFVLQKNSGFNFYIGNRPEAKGYPDIRPGYRYNRLKNTPAREKNLLHPGDQNSFFYGKSFHYILGEPLDWIGLLGRKLYYAITSYRIPVSEPINELARWSGVFSWHWIPYGILIAFGLVGMMGSVQRADASLFVLVFVGSFYGFLLLFSACTRYRIPIVPAVAVFAGPGLFFTAKAVQQRRWTRVGWTLPLVILVLGIGIYPFSSAQEASQAFRAPLYEAKAYWQKGDRTRAISVLSEARGKPAYQEEPMIHYRYAYYLHNYFKRTGKDELNVEGDSTGGRTGGMTHSRMSLRMALRKCLDLINEKNLRYPEPLDLLGNVVFKNGDYQEARSYYKKALRMDSTRRRWVNYGKALLALREFNALDRAMEDALAEYPDCRKCKIIQARGLAFRKKWDQATELLEQQIRELKKTGEKPELLDECYFFRGVVFERRGKFKQAVRFYQKAAEGNSTFAEKARKQLQKMKKSRRENR